MHVGRATWNVLPRQRREAKKVLEKLCTATAALYSLFVPFLSFPWRDPKKRNEKNVRRRVCMCETCIFCLDGFFSQFDFKSSPTNKQTNKRTYLLGTERLRVGVRYIRFRQEGRKKETSSTCWVGHYTSVVGHIITSGGWLVQYGCFG